MLCVEPADEVQSRSPSKDLSSDVGMPKARILSDQYISGIMSARQPTLHHSHKSEIDLIPKIQALEIRVNSLRSENSTSSKRDAFRNKLRGIYPLLSIALLTNSYRECKL